MLGYVWCWHVTESQNFQPNKVLDMASCTVLPQPTDLNELYTLLFFQFLFNFIESRKRNFIDIEYLFYIEI